MENKRFADIANFLLFQGEEVLKPEDLEERDSQEILELYEESDSENYEGFMAKAKNEQDGAGQNWRSVNFDEKHAKFSNKKEKELVMEHLRDILKSAIIRYAKGSYFVLTGMDPEVSMKCFVWTMTDCCSM